jgi:ubiquinone/menaquinone biosynthesis C-methylase UbiE
VKQLLTNDQTSIVADADNADKKAVREFWNRAACGEGLYFKGSSAKDRFDHQASERYKLEPYIKTFAAFESSRGMRVLEIGVGLGADHQLWAEHADELHGIDLTDRAIEYTRQRLSLFGLKSSLQVADAEDLPYDDNYFDIVYSWGVIHHSPNTASAVQEINRVLKPNGKAKVMIYHTHSLVGYMLWIRYALLRLRPFVTLREIYANHLESPGTQAFSIAEATSMFQAFRSVDIRTVLTHGDLLSSSAGQRHSGQLLCVAQAIWPRWLVRRCLANCGLFMLIKAVK